MIRNGEKGNEKNSINGINTIVEYLIRNYGNILIKSLRIYRKKNSQIIMKVITIKVENEN